MAQGPNAPYTHLDQNLILQRIFEETEDRIRVDAVVTATIADVIINAEESNIAIKDPISGNILSVNADGSINADILIRATSGDSILVVGTEDGTTTGTQHVLKIDSNKNANVINMGTLVPKIFDDIAITYATVDSQTVASIVQYYVGGPTGTLVATLTLTYDAFANLTNIQRT